MELTLGYKQTNIGLLPEDWEVTSLGAGLSTFPEYGINAPAVPYSGRLPTYIRITDISDDGRFRPSTLVSVHCDDPERYRLRQGDIVFARTGASVGKSYRYDTDDGELIFAGFLIRVHPDDEQLHPAYVAAYVTTGAYWRWVALMSMRSGQPGINGAEYASLPIPKPPIEEQRAIATALSDVDALLDGLDRLIVKKRDIKQAAMQQLLTGKIRLPGFEGEWLPLNMAKNSTLKARIGWQGLTTAEYLDSGEYGLVTGTDFCGGKIIWESCHFVARVRYDQDRYIQVKEEDILLTKDGTIGKAAYVDHLPFPSTLNSGVFVIRPVNEAYDSRFFFYVLMSEVFKEFLNKLAAGSTISHLYQKDFVNFEFFAPASKAEQAAIAEALSDMDTEIQILEKRRTKTRDLKQAMMQELLTGRTRLV